MVEEQELQIESAAEQSEQLPSAEGTEQAKRAEVDQDAETVSLLSRNEYFNVRGALWLPTHDRVTLGAPDTAIITIPWKSGAALEPSWMSSLLSLRDCQAAARCLLPAIIATH
ncbi:hypothetical protein LTS16_015491 [Friedmanniomyces endolithicus]|nr:hypothetical protein LTR29_013665 [Friedmanniomyces endolithicus]KAK1034412.1 hypothetical protein LTS16_015491 [Friedmanniomyces endolithicus]